MPTHRMPSRSVLRFLWGAVLLFLTVGAAQAASPNARIVSAKGTVQILAVPTGAWVAAASPAAVPPGSAVRTGPKSQAVLELDGAEVTLYETSLIRIPAVPAPASTATNPLRHPWLDAGRALFDVTPRKDRSPFSVQTPMVVAGVKGTVFEVSSTGTEEAVYVWHGLVEVTSRIDGTDIQLVAGGHYTLLDDLRLTPALPIPADRTRPDEAEIHRPAVDTASSTETKRSLMTDAWRDADRAAIKPALDQALDFQSVVSIGTVRTSTDSLTDSLSSTTNAVSESTLAVTDSTSSTLSSGTDSLTSTVVSTVEPVVSTLEPVVDPLTSTLSPVVDPLLSTTSTATDGLLRTLGF